MTSIANLKAAGASDVLLLSREDVKRLLTIQDCIVVVEHAFRLHGEGRAAAPGLLGTHVTGGGFHIKTAVMQFEKRLYYAAKVNANFPENPIKRGLPTIQGAVLLFDAVCGSPLAVMDSIEITSLRTAAATAVAAKRLARSVSQTVMLVGCGLQARAQVQAIRTVLPIKKIFLFDVNEARAATFADELAQWPGVETQAVNALADASRQSDVVITCTTSPAAFLFPEHVRPGTFIAAVGADNEHKQELDPALLRSSYVVADIIEQAAAIGELHHAIQSGLIADTAGISELGKVVAGLQPGRTSEEQITIFDSTGMALQDVAAAWAIYARAQVAPQTMRVALN